jgi:hypothetical protein
MAHRLVTKAELRTALARKRFLAWLKSKPEEEEVGRASSESNCPIACYLREQFVDMRGYSVDRGRILVEDPNWEETEIATPQWAECFIEKVDKGRGFVQARRALEVLDDCR